MKYVVMECYTSFAVVLSEDGRFLNVANMNYQVGQTVNDVFEMDMTNVYPKKGKKGKLFAIIAFSICLILLVIGIFKYFGQPYASVYMSINPSVRMDVKKDNTVMDIEGMNYDGVKLIEGYDYDNKHLELVVDELIEMAMNLGYLSEDDEIRISFDSDDDEWENHMELLISKDVDNKFGIDVNSDDEIDDEDDDDDDDDFDD